MWKADEDSSWGDERSVREEGCSHSLGTGDGSVVGESAGESVGGGFVGKGFARKGSMGRSAGDSAVEEAVAKAVEEDDRLALRPPVDYCSQIVEPGALHALERNDFRVLELGARHEFEECMRRLGNLHCFVNRRCIPRLGKALDGIDWP